MPCEEDRWPTVRATLVTECKRFGMSDAAANALADECQHDPAMAGRILGVLPRTFRPSASDTIQGTKITGVIID